MPESLPYKRFTIGALAACGFTLVMGLLFLPLAGLHYDEILFLHPFLFDWSLFRAPIARTDIPLMVMSYVGALKTWLYWPLYTYLPPSVWTIRLPMLLLATGNVWLIYRLGRRLWDPRAGWLAAALAATDPTLLLSQVFDWGPVTIQVFLSLSAALAYLRWRDTGKPTALALCGLCCGLALWNKAIFVWLLFAVGCAALITWPRYWHPRAWMDTSLRCRLAWAAGLAAFLLGATPFLAYNLLNRTATVEENARFESSFPAYKLQTMAASLDGHIIGTNVGLFAIWEGSCTVGTLRPDAPVPELAGALRWLPWSTWTPWLLMLSVVVALWQWRSRGAATVRFLMLVFLLHSAIAISTIGGGSGLHHYAPLLPALFLAIGGAWSIARTVATFAGPRAARWAPLMLAFVALASPLQAALTLAAWQQRAAQCGGRTIWTHATQALATHVRAHPAMHFYVVDWGIDPQIIYLAEKRGHIADLGELNEEVATDGPRFHRIATLFADANTRLVGFPRDAGSIDARYRRLEELLDLHGYQLVETGRIGDPQGRQGYLLWRLEPLR